MDKDTYKQILLYILFSGTAVLVNIGSRLLLSDYLNTGFYTAVTIAYMMGMLVNFLLNKNYNFPKGPRNSLNELRTFILVALFGLLLTNFFSYLLLAGFTRFQINFGRFVSVQTAAHILAVGLVSVYSFFAHKYFTYKKGFRYSFAVFIKKLLGNTNGV